METTTPSLSVNPDDADRIDAMQRAEFWGAVLTADCVVPPDRGLREMSVELVTMLGSPERHEREDLAAPILTTWVRGGVYDDLLAAFGDGLGDGLLYRLGEDGTESVFRRSWSALVLAAAIRRDNEATLLLPDTVLRWGDRGIGWLVDERDLRGWVEGKGWAQAVGHGAELLAALSMSRHLNIGMRGVLLDAVAERLLTPTEHHLDTPQIDRLAYATMALLHGGGFDQRHIAAWLGRFDRVLARRPSDRERPPAPRVGNAIAYLRALHLQLLLGVRGLAARDDEAHFDGDVPLRRPLLTSLEDLLRQLQDYYRPREVETAQSWLADQAAARDAVGLRRRLRPRDSRGNGLLDLAGNDYLALSRHSEVTTGAVRAARNYGAGSTGSRVVTGTTDIHARLERELAEFVGTPAALVFSSGYLANLGAVVALAGPDALVVSDARNHASLVDACRLARARVVVVPHADASAVARALSSRIEQRALVVTDAVFSVDGNLAPLRELAHVVHGHDAVLVVDDAHGLGVVGPLGQGAVQAAGLLPHEDVVITATLSKALGGQGGAVLASRATIDHLVDGARTFLFDTGLAPPSVGSALAALHVLRREPERVEAVRRNAARLAELARASGLDAARPAAAIVPVRIGSPSDALQAAAICEENGVRVGCFRPPSVPDAVSRLRLTARADLSEADFERAAKALEAVAAAR
jgi:8-amino-7-oxononanoate synthase